MTNGETYLTIDVDAESRPAKVSAAGELDAASSDDLRAALAGLTASGGIEIDLERVSFIDSSGLRVITASMREVEDAGGGLRVVAASDAVRRIFEMTGLQTLLAPAP